MAITNKKLSDFLCESLGVRPEEINLHSEIQQDLGADSLDVVEMVMELEDEYQISIPDEDVSKLKTVQNILDYLEQKGVE